MTNRKFNRLEDIHEVLSNLPESDAQTLDGAKARNDQLTKPVGSLGRLEDLAIWYAGWRQSETPSILAPQVVVFAGNHGVAARGVSAFPPEVTVQMVANFDAGGAAVNQLARTVGAQFSAIALDLETPTADFTSDAAMTMDAFLAAFSAGWDAVDPRADLLVTGEMGIGNTTSAAAVAMALFGGDAADWTGRGTGVGDDAFDLKSRIVADGVARHAGTSANPLEVLRCLGGRELAAMAGAILHARVLRIPVILDGFICCAAAAALEVARPGTLDHAVAGHLSAEGAHRALLGHLAKPPILSLDMRLGEGSGAVLAIAILQGAVACLSGMATFSDAGVSGAS